MGIGIGLRSGLLGNGAFTNTISTLFDGVDDFAETAGDVPALNSLTRMTWSLWFKYTNLTTDKVMITKWDFTSQGSWAFQSGTSDASKIRIFIADNINDGGSNQLNTTGVSLTAGVWVHMAVVYDGSLSAANRVRCYLDSVLQSASITGTIPTSLTNGSSTVKVGKFGESLSRNFDGNIDEIGIFPTVAFNQAEVNEIYNSGVPFDLNTHSQAGNLNNYWRMGDGSTFPTITDVQGNDDLTMTNMAANDFVTDTP